jgi:hypothetical protein
MFSVLMYIRLLQPSCQCSRPGGSVTLGLFNITYITIGYGQSEIVEVEQEYRLEPMSQWYEAQKNCKTQIILSFFANCKLQIAIF